MIRHGCLRLWYRGFGASCFGCKRHHIQAAPPHPASGCIR
jgi:hypothetical protein